MTGELVVDGAAFAANLARVRRMVAPAEHMLVVKDDAYGHGLVPAVERAWADGVSRFGAFDVRTGAGVREALGPGAEIFTWIVASRTDAEAAVAHDLQVGVGDRELLEDVAAAAHAAGRPAVVHLKIDTGLHRNGVRPEEWDGFVARAAALEATGGLRVVGVWSHIAEASDAEDDAARTLFDDAWHRAVHAGLRPRMRHLAASAASFARPEFRYDVVRVGAFAYGIRPADGPSEAELGIRPIARLRAPVTEVDAHAVTVAHGALHGLPSVLAGRAAVGTPRGARPLLRVDDLSCRVQPWPGAQVGDTVTIYGPGDDGESSATDLAEAIDTIGEEIALRVAPGIPRRWV